MRWREQMRLLLLLLLTLGALLSTASPAAAAVVSLRLDDFSDSKNVYVYGALTVIDTADAADDLLLRRDGLAVIVEGSPMPTAGSGCTQLAPGAVRCAASSPGVSVDTANVDLGAGNDRLNGFMLSGTVTGGDGDDRLDVVSEPDVPTSVQWDGGPGADTVSVQGTTAGIAALYSDRSAPVSLSFDGLANDGEVGEGDNIGVSGGASGGAGADVLSAGAGGSTLNGGGGNDQLIGGGGKDELSGGNGDDNLTGGDDDDSFTGGAGADTMDGGAGDDRFVAAGYSTAPNSGDVLRGGPGNDSAMLGDQGFRPFIDLQLGPLAPGAAASAVGSTTDIEDIAVYGSRVVLRGTSADERLDLAGRSGSVLDGGAGDDVLSASTGRRIRTTIIGGPGHDEIRPRSANDVLKARDGEIDDIFCPYEGLLTTPQVDRVDRLRGCGVPAVSVRRPITLRGSSLTVAVRCPTQTPGPCRGHINASYDRVDEHTERLRAGYRIANGATGPVTFTLGRRGLSRIRRAIRRDSNGDGLGVSVQVVRDLSRQIRPVTSSDTLTLTAPPG